MRKEFILPNNRKSQFDIYYDKESACIVAFTPDKSVILVRQYRPGPEKILLELPGGAVSPGEKPEEAIRRELLEEAGYSGEIQLVGSNYCSSLSDGIRYNFVGFNCVQTQAPSPDKEEFIEVVHLNLEEFIQLVRSGQMTNVDGAYMVLHSLNLLH